MKEFTKRLLVTVFGVPIALGIVYIGGWLFASVVIILSGMALWEFYKMAEKKGMKPLKRTGIISHTSILLFVFLIIPKMDDGSTALFFISLLFLFSFIILIFELFRRKENAMMDISGTLSGMFYITISFCFMLFIRELYNIPVLTEKMAGKIMFAGIDKDWCSWLITSIFLSVWIGDSAAYLLGKAFGRHKLYPSVSPKKSWEGAIACFVFSIAGFYIPVKILLPEFDGLHSVAIGSIIGIIGQLGDLAESKLKRDAGLKDSSTILPGHGGMLDRFDSLLFVVPAVFIYLLILIVYGI